MMVKQRDIILVPFPFTDLSSSKKRPALVISNEVINKSHDIILVQISAALHNDDFSFRILKNMTDIPLKYDSEIRMNKLVTLDKTIIERKICSMLETPFNELLSKIKNFL